MSDFKKKQQELKKPDAFQKKLYGYFMWAKSNPQVLVKLALPLFGIVVIAIGWLSWMDHMSQSRKDALAAIDMIYDKEEMDLDHKRKEISKQIQDLSANKDDQEKNKDKIKSLEDEVKNLKTDHKDSLPKYLSFFEKHSTDSEGWRAGMESVQIYVANKDFEKASILLGDLLNKAASSSFYQTQGRSLYVSVLEELGKFDQAAIEAATLVKTAKEADKPKALLTHARVLLLSGKKTEAMQILDELITKHNASAEAQKAKAMKAVF